MFIKTEQFQELHRNMKTIFGKTSRNELIESIRLTKIGRLSEVDEYLPDVETMTLYEGMSLGKNKYKQAFIRRLLCKMALSKVNPINI